MTMTADAAVKPRRSVAGRAGDVALTVASIGGVLCIVLVILAVVFHITLIMFKTGSMSPTIPAGSLAVVREIPAAEIKVGDVVTVDRSPALPVTHRVVSIAPAGGDARSIVLRGDANPVNDASPYIVSHVRIVLWSVPQLAYLVTAVSNPIALGAITLGAAGIVTWAFWPRGASAAARKRKRPARHAMTGGALLLALAFLPVFAQASPANAAGTTDVISGEYLTLTSIGDKGQMAHLVPGVVVPWQIGIAANPPDPGVIDVTLTAQGALAQAADGLIVTVSSCATEWIAGACAGGGTVLLGPGAASALIGGSVQLFTMPSDQARWLLVQASLPANPATLPVGSAMLGVQASGSGETVTAGGSVGTVASTGVDLWPPLAAAVASVVLGLVIALAARTLTRREVHA